LDNFLEDIVKKYRFTFQEQQILKTIEKDLLQWGEKSLEDIWDFSLENRFEGKKLKKELLSYVKKHYEELKNKPTNYKDFNPKVKPQKIKIQQLQKDSLGFGACPVASEKTRCCNLLTLDAVESCGYDCSYCSIQSFYNEGKVVFDQDFQKKLDAINLDPNEFYHIGTGQSSDSLMWGNRYGVLDALVEFAKKNPNVLLEFKTKSDNISYFLDKKDLPKNLLFTWSLNPQIVIDKEEHLTASLDERLQAARKIADMGMLVGFHFHPMIYIEDFEKEYGIVFDKLKDMFDPQEVVLVSLGTLTFIKPVIKKIRSRDFQSRILKLPMSDASGKLSYPLDIKEKMFSFAYQSLKESGIKMFTFICVWKIKVCGKKFLDMSIRQMKALKWI